MHPNWTSIFTTHIPPVPLWQVIQLVKKDAIVCMTNSILESQKLLSTQAHIVFEKINLTLALKNSVWIDHDGNKPTVNGLFKSDIHESHQLLVTWSNGLCPNTPNTTFYPTSLEWLIVKKNKAKTQLILDCF